MLCEKGKKYYILLDKDDNMQNYLVNLTKISENSSEKFESYSKLSASFLAQNDKAHIIIKLLFNHYVDK